MKTTKDLDLLKNYTKDDPQASPQGGTPDKDKEALDSFVDNATRVNSAKVTDATTDPDDKDPIAEPKKNNVRDIVDNVQETVNNTMAPIANNISGWYMVGGIGLLLGVIILLLFIVVQVNANGDTRLKMLWYALNGQAALQGRVKPSGVTGGGTSGNFGGPSTAPVTPPPVSPLVPLTTNNGTFRTITGV